MTVSIYYNGVILRDCEVKSFDQQIVLDEGGTDVLYSRLSISVSATLVDYYYSASNTLPTTIALDNAILATVERMDVLTQRLSEARKDFWFIVGGQSPPSVHDELTQVLAAGELSVGGVDTISAHPTDGAHGTLPRADYIDCEGGPHPMNVRIEQIFGGRAMRVNATFKVCRKVCDSSFVDAKPDEDPNIQSSPFVLSNRWYLDESKDDNWVTTKTLQGTLKTAHPTYFSQLYRSLVLPPLMKGYYRVNQSFVSDTTNTTLKYRVTDRQMHAFAPPPAIKWNGTHTESTTKQGARQTANVSVRLQGPPGVNKSDLIAAAGRVITSRIASLQNKDKPAGQDSYETVLQNLNIVDHLGEPTIEMSASALYTSAEYKWLAMRVKTMTREDDDFDIDGYVPTEAPVPLPYDSATPAGIMGCYLQHPCSVWHGIGGSNIEEETGVTNTRPDPKEAYPADSYEYPPPKSLTVDDDKIEYDTSERYNVFKYPYNYYTLSHRYNQPQGVLQLPFASNDDQVTAAILKVHSGIAEKIIEFEGTRDGRPPVIPEPLEEFTDANGVRQVLIDFTVITRAPELTSDGHTHRHGIAGKIIYALERPLTTEERYATGSLPQDKTEAKAAGYNFLMFKDINGKVSDR